MNAIGELWRFSRPHTVIGTTISLVSLWVIAQGIFRASIFAVVDDNSSSISLSHLGITWLAIIAANIYIVGLNQLTDIELDRINKPYLPLASGAWSPQIGRGVVLASLFLSTLAVLISQSVWLGWTVGLSLLLGTAYSLPPLRLKRFNFWAAFCIIAVRSLIVNVLLFAHVANWRAPLMDLPPLVWLLVFVMFAYSVAIAWFKDLPDDRGDAAYGVDTLTVKHGKAFVLRSGAILLSSALLLTALASWLSGRFGDAGNKLAASHALILLAFIALVWRVDLDNAQSIRRFYLSLWALFFLEYGIFAWAAWLL